MGDFQLSVPHLSEFDDPMKVDLSSATIEPIRLVFCGSTRHVYDAIVGRSLRSQTEPVRSPLKNTSNRSTSTTTPHTPATLLNTKKKPFNFIFRSNPRLGEHRFGAKIMAFNPELGSTSPAVLLDNAERLDKLVNGPAADVTDRGGDPLYSWRQMMAKNDEVRQNIIPLSKQYATLAEAQADIANIPEGAPPITAARTTAHSPLEVINNGGTLEPTGRAMPSAGVC